MKKFFLLTFLLIGISSTSFSQMTGKGSEKSGGFMSKIFRHERKPHGQMRHFGKRKKDPNIKHNGTSASKDSNRSRNKVDGDGFGVANQNVKKRIIRKRK